MTQSISKVIVFGSTGAIGTSLIEIMTKNHPTWEIIAVSRSGSQSDSALARLKLPRVTLVKGDAEDKDRVQELCADVQLVFCTVGFNRYEAKYWGKHWPVVIDNLLAATDESKPLVFCDNLYAYGSRTNITTASPLITPSMKSKPAIRALLREKLQARMDENRRSIVVVGGADFFGPYVTKTSFLGDTFVGNMVNGSKPMAVGTADAIHDFCFSKDCANALYVASIHPEQAYGKFWIAPHSIHQKTMRQIAQDVNQLLEKPVKGVTVLPVFMVNTLGLFMTFMSELKEMLPWWTQDYTITDTAFSDTFGVPATPYGEALKEYVEFYKTNQKD